MSSRQAKAPISAHPLFPAVVAVWFAALFGLGSGVLPSVLFERVITATHLSSLIPSATPPLGATFRIILSLSFAAAGAALGFMLARRLAAANYIERPASVVSQITPRTDPVPVPRAAADGKRRPISVKEELGNTRLDPIVPDEEDARSLPIPPRLGTRRRSLALAEEEGKSDFFTHAPVALAETPAPEPAITPEEPAMDQPLDLTSFAPSEFEPEPGPVEDPVHVSQAEPRIEPHSIVDRGLQGLRNRSPFAKPFGDEGEPPVTAATAFAPLAEPPVEEIASVAEPLPFDPPIVAGPEPEQISAAAPTPVLPTDPSVDLSDLGMVQLAERLAASLRNRLSHPSASPAFIAGLKADFGLEAAAEVEPEAIAPGSAIFGGAGFEPVAPDAAPPPPVIPAALRPLPLDFAEDEDDDAPIPSLSLPLAGLTPAADADEEDEFDDIGEAEENYSSLLAMKNPFHAPAEFVRIDEPEQEEGSIEPAVVFPGEIPAAESATPAAAPEPRPFDGPSAAPFAPTPQRERTDPEETERALRSALATLQRMSGAA